MIDDPFLVDYKENGTEKKGMPAVACPGLTRALLFEKPVREMCPHIRTNVTLCLQSVAMSTTLGGIYVDCQHIFSDFRRAGGSGLRSRRWFEFG